MATTKRNAKSNESAEGSYLELKKRIDMHLARISNGLKVKGEMRKSEKIHWGHVGDLAEISSKLKDVADFLNDTGEYSATERFR